MHPLSFGLNLPAVPASVSVVRHLFGGVKGIWPVSDAQLHDIQIAVSEACTNVIKHAYDRTAPGMLEVHGILDRDEIVVHVRDNGPGMRPSSAPGLGVGLALIAALTLRMEVGRVANGAHQVSMVFAAGGVES
ncbi:MAG: putative anti-sigma regulatory factor, serine/threonine protein kinase [Solirubrobacterales bacterium]|nr:putative anti-sigma regulatory factor, serine/threonine protein kinase [Solirubrobacterales bacterium]